MDFCEYSEPTGADNCRRQSESLCNGRETTDRHTHAADCSVECKPR